MDKQDIELLNDIKTDNTKLLWYSDKYDGIPKSGLMKYNSSICWYIQYDTDCIERYSTDCQLLKAGHKQEDIDLMTNDDREWLDETFYYKVYKLSKNDIKHINKDHNRFRKYVGTHCDYEGKRILRKSNLRCKYYNKDDVDRHDSLNSLLDNFFIKLYKRIFKNKHSDNISEVGYDKDKIKSYDKDVIGYFKI